MAASQLKNLIYVFVSLSFILTSCLSSKPVTEKESEPSPPVEEIPSAEIAEYILGFGDGLEISMFRHPEMNRKTKILPDGKIHYPLVGEIQAEGLSVSQLRDVLREKLLKYFVDPQIDINVTSTGSQKILVLGEVKRPGVYQLEGPKTVIEAVSEAGGLTLDAKERNVMLIRGAPSNPQPRILDIEAALTRTDMTQNVALQKLDIVYVPSTTIANVQRFFDRIWTIIPVRYGFLWRIE